MLWQNQAVSALNIWQPNEAIGAATAMIVCQTKPENMFLIETLCFWAYRKSTLCIFQNDESTIFQVKMCQAITMNDLDECELLYSQLLDADDFPKFNPSAKAAADLDNLDSAFQHLDGSHPVAINTDEPSIEYMRNKLFLDPPPSDLFLLPGQPATCPPGFCQNLLPDDNKFITAM
jgi:hypothetical protein